MEITDLINFNGIITNFKLNLDLHMKYFIIYNLHATFEQIPAITGFGLRTWI